MNTLLGGSFSSRLNMNLREKHGYTYGASSGFDMRASAGPFTAFAGVQTDKTAEALKEFFNELNGILKPVPADELARAKNYVVAALSRRRSKPPATSRGGSRTRSSITCPTITSRRTCRTSRPSAPPTLQRVAQKYIQPDRVAVVIVGDMKAIEPGIRALNLGPIHVLTIDDVFGPAPSM